jgi:hypothetical protein
MVMGESEKVKAAPGNSQSYCQEITSSESAKTGSALFEIANSTIFAKTPNYHAGIWVASFLACTFPRTSAPWPAVKTSPIKMAMVRITTVNSIKVNAWESADRLYMENLLGPLAGLESSKILPAAQLFR